MKNIVLTRNTGKWTDILPIAIILSIAAMLTGPEIVNSVPVIKQTIVTALTPFFGSADVTAFWFQYFIFIAIWITFLLIVTIFKSNRPMLKAVAYNKTGNNLRGALIGLLVGFGANGLCILISWLSGNIHLTFNGFNPVMFLIFFVTVLIQSSAEEIIDRCYLYQKLRRGYKNPWVAIVGNAIIFSLIHIFNPGISVLAIVNIMVTGVLLSLIVYYFDSLWAAIMIHTAWNFTQNIIFGLPNSGQISKYSLFSLDTATAKQGFFYDVAFGVEGSIGAICVIILLCVVVYFLGRKYGKKRDYWAEEEERIEKEESLKEKQES